MTPGWGPRATRIAFLLLGCALLGWLVVSSDVASILADLSRIGPGLVLILGLELMTDAFNTLGWWFTIPVAERTRIYPWLFWVRSAGTALNDATPLASLGGESAKLVLLGRRMSSAAAAASLLASRMSFSTAKAIFIVVGMAVVWPRLAMPREISLPLLSGFVLVLVGIATFAVVQVRGVGAGTIGALERAGVPARWIARIDGWLHGVDAHLRDLYRARPGDLVRSMGAYSCGFACGTIQILLLLGWLGLSFDFGAALGIEAFSTLVGFLMFVVPGSLGVQEGGKVLVFAALGLPRSAAMAVGITFRLISLTEIAMGLVAFVLLQHQGRTSHGSR